MLQYRNLSGKYGDSMTPFRRRICTSKSHVEGQQPCEIKYTKYQCSTAVYSRCRNEFDCAQLDWTNISLPRFATRRKPEPAPIWSPKPSNLRKGTVRKQSWFLKIL